MKPNEDQLPDILRELQGKGDGFKRPSADYFSQITERAMAEAQSAKPVQLKAKPRQLGRWLAYAASLALLVSVAWQFRPGSTPSSTATASVETSSITLEDLDDAEIMEYIDDNLSDFELEQLAVGAELY